MSAEPARRFGFAALLVIAGLFVEVATLTAVHPAAFLTFLVGGGALAAAGGLLCLSALLRSRG